ncbi:MULTISPECIES: hypothetical protein [unclassified Gordonia (in: high G+C Gram-positive bacteria)]
MSADGRRTLAERQEELVRALVAGGAAPEGIDAARLRITEEALLRKRAGEVARRLPLARAELGCRFGELFVEWARGRPRRPGDEEAGAFTEHLIAVGAWVPPAVAGRRRRLFLSRPLRSRRS